MLLANRLRRSERGIFMLDFIAAIALLAIIYAQGMAILSDQRVRAFASTTQADATTLGTQLESYFNDNGSYPDPASAAAGTLTPFDSGAGQASSSGIDNGVLTQIADVLSPGNSVGYYVTTGEYFAFCVQHESGSTKDAYSVYASAPLTGVSPQGGDPSISTPAGDGVVLTAKDRHGRTATCPALSFS